MKHRRSYGLIVPAVFILFTACSRPPAPEAAASSANLAVPVKDTAPAPPPPLPESIPGLRLREYAAPGFTFRDPVDAIEGLEAREFSYQSDGYTVYGLVERPAGEAPEGGWPVIVLAHGYIPPDSWSTRNNYRLVSRYYAAGGFLVVKPDYRGHGRSEGPSGSRGPSPTIDYSIDVLNLIAGLEAVPEADTGNVFLYGHSMGGEIGLRILTVSDVLKGATLWAGVTEDFPENTLYFIRKRSAGEAETHRSMVEAAYNEEDYASMSPGNYLDSIEVPILVHHGTEDESVPFQWSIPFRQRLDAAGVDYVFHEYPGEDHNISGSFYEVMDRDMAFFRSLLD